MKLRKSFIKLFCCFCLLLGLTMVMPQNAQAKSTFKKVGSLNVVDGTTFCSFAVDLDGDGITENVQAFSTNDDSYLTDLSIYVGDDSDATASLYLSNKTMDYSFDVDITYVSLSSTKKFLVLCGLGDDDYTTFNRVYKYVASTGKFTRVADLNDYPCRASELTGVTSTSLKVTYYQQPTTLGSLKYTLKFNYASGKFTLNSDTVSATSLLGSAKLSDGMAPYFAKNQFKTKKSLALYTSAGSSTKSVTVPKNKFVTLKKVKVVGNNTMYAQFSYGSKTGWRRLKNKTSQWFYGVLDRLAG